MFYLDWQIIRGDTIGACLPIKLCGSGRTNQPLVGLFRRHYLEAGEKAYRNDKTKRPRKPCKHKASRVLLMSMDYKKDILEFSVDRFEPPPIPVVFSMVSLTH